MINKLDFTSFFECEKKTWLSNHTSITKKYNDDAASYLADQKNNRTLFCNTKTSHKGDSENTMKLLSEGKTIQNATIQIGDLSLDFDLIEMNGSLITFTSFFNLPSNEVKAYLDKGTSDSSLKSVLHEMAFLMHSLQVAGYIVSAKLATINSMYYREAELDLNKAFFIFDMSNSLPVLFPVIEELLTKLREQATEPEVMVGTQCKNPIECPFRYNCWKNLTDKSIHNIPRISTSKRTDFLSKKWETIDQIEDLTLLTDNQKFVVKNILSGKVIKQPMKLMMFLSRLQYPIYHLDFEAIMPSLPMFEGTRAFDTIPTQYSLHIEQRNGDLEHKEFLEIEKTDPRWNLITNLLKEIGDKGSVLVYNKAFEQGVLQSMIRWFPSLEREITNVINRLVDLMVPFKDGDYFHPNMFFSYSLKYVLPALVPSVTYEHLNIKNGGQIMSVMTELYNTTDLVRKEQLRQDLLLYCKQDTIAMVEILKVLRKA